jgi:catechol 2,3-dioxygenase-like lactoylglutathione lyase family enzyme
VAVLTFDPLKGDEMPRITQLGRVMVPVADQDAAIAFYTEKLGFSLAADVPFGDGERWIEVAPPGGGAALALVPARGDYQPGRMTGVALETADARADRQELAEKGVDVDAELMGGDGTVPLLFSFRDLDANHLMVVEAQ